MPDGFRAGVAAAAQTFGLDGGRAALASRSQAEWVTQTQALEKQGTGLGLRRLAIDYLITRDEWVAREAVRVLRGLSEAKRACLSDILFAGG